MLFTRDLCTGKLLICLHISSLLSGQKRHIPSSGKTMAGN